jgi:hypothetical protein
LKFVRLALTTLALPYRFIWWITPKKS